MEETVIMNRLENIQTYDSPETKPRRAKFTTQKYGRAFSAALACYLLCKVCVRVLHSWTAIAAVSGPDGPIRAVQECSTHTLFLGSRNTTKLTTRGGTRAVQECSTHTLFLGSRNTTKLTTRGGTSPDGVEEIYTPSTRLIQAGSRTGWFVSRRGPRSD